MAWFTGLGEPQSEISRLTAELAAMRKRAEKAEKLDGEASMYVESVICMRTGFTGEPPYVGWKGLGLALNDALDERYAFETDNARLRAALEQPVARHEAEITILGVRIRVYTLDDGSRVINADDAAAFFGALADGAGLTEEQAKQLARHRGGLDA